jgi:hypothetical protein
MSTLTYTGTDLATGERAANASRRSFWRRVYDSIILSQQRRAEREIARYLGSNGGLMTDGMEREIMQRLSGNTKRPL